MPGCFVPVFELLEQRVVSAAIEAPFTLLQKPVEIVWREPLEPPQMPLRLVPEVLNAGDMMPALRHEDLAVVHTSVVKLRDISHIVCGEAIRIDDTVWGYLLTNDRQPCSCFCIRNNRRKYFPASF